jgi:sugar phosphate isomerase/epimerase
MNLPTIAICNLISNTALLRKFALQHGFSGVDWTFRIEDIPRNRIDESRLLKNISLLNGLEVLYHCAFQGVDLGDEDDLRAYEAMKLLQKVCRVVSRLEGEFMTVHLGLGRQSPEGLSWERTTRSLSDLADYAETPGAARSRPTCQDT